VKFVIYNYLDVQEVCYTQTFPPWSVMTLATGDVTGRHGDDGSDAEHDVIDDVDHQQQQRILVRKGCVQRSVNSALPAAFSLTLPSLTALHTHGTAFWLGFL